MKRAARKKATKAARKKVARRRASRKGAARKRTTRKRAARRRTTRRTTGKRAARKTVARKSAAKAKKPKKPKKPKKAKCDMVVLSQPSGPDHVPYLRKKKKEQVCWRNDDVITHTLTFTVWPFLEPPQSIVVAPDQITICFTANPDMRSTTYSYGISPPFPAQGPPDPPEVVFGD